MEHYKLNIQEIPWSRIVHWYGRATDYPKYFDFIHTGNAEQQQEAIAKIKTTIEHQDGIIYVTPIALPFIYDLLSKKSTDKKGLLEIIDAVLSAVIFQYEYFEIDHTLKKLTAKELIRDEFLWAEFIDENEDDFLWEEYSYEPQYWLELTTDILLGEEHKLLELKTSSKEIADLKNGIIENTNKLRHIIEKQ